ncbi:hypothetical protein [Mycobacterium uberis]|uniref:hypothetical protein n=1 Tax=Mycobacterium uberis TaxID=2162698 RepID=UPI001FB2C1B9|nr:hypothetical protein [Mycobacterium uberis]
MRIGAMLRPTGLSLLDRWYTAIVHELYSAGGKPHDLVVAQLLLGDTGVDLTILDGALADPSTQDGIRAEHQWIVDAGDYGVPTLSLPGSPPTANSCSGLCADRCGRPEYCGTWSSGRPNFPELIGRFL